MEKTLQGKESIFDNGIMCLKKKKAIEASTQEMHKGTERHEYYKMDNPTKLNIMFWNTLSPSISCNSVTLQRKMELQKKTPIRSLSLRHIQALVIQTECIIIQR